MLVKYIKRGEALKNASPRSYNKYEKINEQYEKKNKNKKLIEESAKSKYEKTSCRLTFLQHYAPERY